MRRLPIIAALDRDESGVIEATEIEGASRALATSSFILRFVAPLNV